MTSTRSAFDTRSASDTRSAFGTVESSEEETNEEVPDEKQHQSNELSGELSGELSDVSSPGGFWDRIRKLPPRIPSSVSGNHQKTQDGTIETKEENKKQKKGKMKQIDDDTISKTKKTEQ